MTMKAKVLEQKRPTEYAKQVTKNFTMKKDNPFKYNVSRINTSPYFSANFLELEKDTINNIAQVEMLAHPTTAPADIIITNTHTKIDQLSLAELNQCKLMIHPNSGYDNFSAEFVKNTIFPIVIGNPIRSHAVTNYILSALLNHYSSIVKEPNWNASRKWPRKLLSELNILVIGAGHIGSLLEQSLSPLVAKIQIYDPYKSETQIHFKNIDVVIPACSLNKENYHFINQHFLEKLNHDFLLINAARGQLVNTADLISILKERPKAFAILDVFEQEPFDFNEFLGLQNVLLSSHIAGVYKNIDHATIQFEFEVISDFIKLETLDFEEKYHNMLLKNKIMNDYLI